MSLLYKPENEQTTTVEIKQNNGFVELDFWADCGKFGTDEPIAGWKLTPKRLLEILSNYNEFTEEELL